jgi:hypothetical protein
LNEPMQKKDCRSAGKGNSRVTPVAQ